MNVSNAGERKTVSSSDIIVAINNGVHEFSNLIIEDDLNFERLNVEHGLFFTLCDFAGYFNFSDCKIKGLYLNVCRLTKGFSFNKLVIDSIDISHTWFEGDAQITSSEISKRFDFISNKVFNRFSINKSIFSCGFWIIFSKFTGDVSLDGITFQDIFFLSESEFNANFSVHNLKFEDGYRFDNSTFNAIHCDNNSQSDIDLCNVLTLAKQGVYQSNYSNRLKKDNPIKLVTETNEN